MQVTYIRCSQCNHRCTSDDLACPRCGAPIDGKPYAKPFKVPDGFDLYGVYLRGRGIELQFAIRDGTIELRNLLQRLYVLKTPEAFPILKPVISTLK